MPASLKSAMAAMVHFGPDISEKQLTTVNRLTVARYLSVMTRALLLRAGIAVSVVDEQCWCHGTTDTRHHACVPQPLHSSECFKHMTHLAGSNNACVNCMPAECAQPALMCSSQSISKGPENDGRRHDNRL